LAIMLGMVDRFIVPAVIWSCHRQVASRCQLESISLPALDGPLIVAAPESVMKILPVVFATIFAASVRTFALDVPMSPVAAVSVNVWLPS